ncbi:MAG: D-serine ammonia-lyase, partial [Promethearchaeota archaeon]
MATPKNILGLGINLWKEKFPLLPILLEKKVVFWFNPKLARYEFVKDDLSVTTSQLQDAEDRWIRFASYFRQVYPETIQFDGRIQSALKSISQIHNKLNKFGKKPIPGNFYAKLDNELSVAGSIKARGGIYEVLSITDKLLHEKWQFTDDFSYLQIIEPKFQAFFQQYTISVGSTGNLGLSIGLIAQKLGYKTRIYMSNDAKQWKKEKLRSNGVEIVEIDGDYTEAVRVGRKAAEDDPMTFFIDDEQSFDLFYGYAVAAFELQSQLATSNIMVDQDHPLFIYLPCGVGTSPGGITYGLKTIFGDNVHCFFVEPVACPSMLLGLLTQKHHEISIEDFGISSKTDADGLACARPS